MALVAKYSLNGNANDGLGVNNGTATNVAWVDGKLNQAASFNGTSSYISCNPSSLTNNFSILLLVNLSSASLKGCFFNVGGVSAAKGYSLGVGSGTMDSNGNQLIILLDGVKWIATGRDIGTGYHLVGLQRDAGLWKYIIDGVIYSTGDSTNPSTPITNTIIGANDISDPPYNRYFTGILDELEFYNNVLSPGEIKMKHLYCLGYM